MIILKVKINTNEKLFLEKESQLINDIRIIFSEI